MPGLSIRLTKRTAVRIRNIVHRFNLSNMGEAALRSHMRSKRHVIAMEGVQQQHGSRHEIECLPSVSEGQVY